MNQTIKIAKENIFKAAVDSGFIDPLTGTGPSSETELSSLLVLFHSDKSIRWDEVPLYDMKSNISGNAASIISQAGYFIPEYPLLSKSDDEGIIWGGMKADIMHFDRNGDIVVLIENKIGSDFTYGKNVEDWQLARQLKYLKSNKAKDRYFIMLTLKAMLNAGWYVTELYNTMEYHKMDKHIKPYVMLWEDILMSIKGQQRHRPDAG